MLALQLIRLMDKIWVRAGLDLRLITYQVLATGEEQGMVEVVTDSATLRQIQTEHGLTGSFKDKPLYEWLMRYNPSDTAWKNVCVYYSIYVCMYVCMFVCMHLCMYVCMFVCLYVCIYVCMYVCMYIYMLYVCMYVYIYIYS